MGFAFWNNIVASAWWVLWLLLGTITIALVVLLRTRWKKMRPLKQCAILSLWVHVVLACLATMVRIFSGSPGLGPDEPIRVALVTIEQLEAEPQPQPAESSPPPDWQLPKNSPLAAPELEPVPPAEIVQDNRTEPQAVPEQTVAPADIAPAAPPHESASPPAPPAETPKISDSPEPKPESELELETEPDRRADPPSADRQPIQPRQQPSQADSQSRSQPPTSNPQPPASSPTYADRFAKNRQQLVAQRGGNQHTERAVRSALAWLAAAQSEDGRWDASRHGAGREQAVLGQNRHSAGANADTGVTGLALLAFLGSGHTHGHGPYATQVARGLDYLRRSQTGDGALYGDAQLFARTYCHSMATFAVCEAYALTRDQRVAPVARAATTYSLNIQNPSTGGWRYRPGDAGDTSQLGWQLMALKSAQLAGVDIPTATWTGIERFLRRVRRGADGGLAAYRPAGPASRTMTAEALFCWQLLSSPTGVQVDLTAVDEAVRSIATLPPSTQHMNLYYWYYATLALHQAQNQTPTARKAWDQWNRALVQSLLATQQSDGSWGHATIWGGYGGRVYTTALATLCLEVYYRYTPEEQQTGIAGRNGWRSIPR